MDRRLNFVRACLRIRADQLVVHNYVRRLYAFSLFTPSIINALGKSSAFLQHRRRFLTLALRYRLLRYRCELTLRTHLHVGLYSHRHRWIRRRQDR